MWENFLYALEDSSVGSAIRMGNYHFPTIESLHVLALAVVAGSIFIVDLRLMGVASHRRGVNPLICELLPYTWGAFAIAVITGSLLVVSRASEYLISVPFLWKMGVIALAGINMLVFHFKVQKTMGSWDERLPPLAARLSGMISLCLWVLVLFLGRWIGFSSPF